jgi:hypothetical protein
MKKLAAIFGFAYRARGNRHDLVHTVGLGQAFELREHLERGMRSFGRERAAVKASGAQPDHFLFAVDDFKGKVRPDPHHDHVQGIGPDVDGSQAHDSTIIKA